MPRDWAFKVLSTCKICTSNKVSRELKEIVQLFPCTNSIFKNVRLSMDKGTTAHSTFKVLLQVQYPSIHPSINNLLLHALVQNCVLSNSCCSIGLPFDHYLWIGMEMRMNLLWYLCFCVEYFSLDLQSSGMRKAVYARC